MACADQFGYHLAGINRTSIRSITVCLVNKISHQKHGGISGKQSSFFTALPATLIQSCGEQGQERYIEALRKEEVDTLEMEKSSSSSEGCQASTGSTVKSSPKDALLNILCINLDPSMNTEVVLGPDMHYVSRRLVHKRTWLILFGSLGEQRLCLLGTTVFYKIKPFHF